MALEKINKEKERAIYTLKKLLDGVDRIYLIGRIPYARAGACR